MGKTECKVTLKKRMWPYPSETKNCECLPPSEKDFCSVGDGNMWREPKEKWSQTKHDNWLAAQSNLCQSLGDCGITENMLGKDGYNKKEDLVVA